MTRPEEVAHRLMGIEKCCRYCQHWKYERGWICSVYAKDTFPFMGEECASFDPKLNSQTSEEKPGT